MRALLPLLAALSVCATAGLSPAVAQVTLNLDAIEQQPGKPRQPAKPQQATPRASRPAAQQRPAAKPAPAKPAPAKPAAQGTATGAQPGKPGADAAAAAAAAGAAAAITIPAAPEPMPTIPPPPAPTATPAPPPRPPTVANANTAVAQRIEGVRVTFEAGKSDLSPAAAEALQAFAKKVPNQDTVTLNVAAYASGGTEDPSTPRRVALARALAIRTALMAEGIASTRIYVRALGATGDVAAGPADRVDVSVLGLGSAFMGNAVVAKP